MADRAMWCGTDWCLWVLLIVWRVVQAHQRYGDLSMELVQEQMKQREAHQKASLSKVRRAPLRLGSLVRVCV